MTLPAAQLVMVHGVLQFSGPTGRDPGRDELLLDAIKPEFPNVVTRQYLPTDTPPNAPHLIVTSTSSQLAISAVQADWEVRFYGDYLLDLESALAYVENKLRIVLAGLSAADIQPVIIGLVASMHFPYAEGDRPAEHVLETLLKTEVDPEHVQDAMARVALRISDKYFVTLTVSNYEARIWERPLFPGQRAIAFAPWESQVQEVGLEVVIDINNGLEARSLQAAPVITETGVAAVTRLLREVATSAGPKFAETGELALEDLSASIAR